MNEVESAIKAHYASYLDAFHEQDAAAVATHYAAPCVFITEDSVTVLHSTAEVQTLFEKILAALRKQNYSHSDVQDHEVTLLGERLALLRGRATRYTTEGVEFERVGAAYTLRLEESGWKIVTAMAHELLE